MTFEGADCPACVEPWPVVAAGARGGAMTSAARSPDLATNIGFAMIDRAAWDIGTAVTVETPAGARAGRVAALPFV